MDLERVVHGEGRNDPGAPARCAIEADLPTEHLCALAHGGEPHHLGIAQPRVVYVETRAVVLNDHSDPIAYRLDRNLGMGSMRMRGHIGEGFLHDTEYGHLELVRQAAVQPIYGDT